LVQYLRDHRRAAAMHADDADDVLFHDMLITEWKFIVQTALTTEMVLLAQGHSYLIIEIQCAAVTISRASENRMDLQ
jgi:hypothetical protein